MMRYIIILIATISFYSCGGQSVQLSNNQPESAKTTYLFELSSDKFKIIQETEFTIASIRNDTIIINSEIKKMEYKDGSDMEGQINNGYTQYVNRPLYFEMNKQGEVLKNLTYTNLESDAAAVFDVKLYFLNYSNELISTGSSWSEKRETTDMMFDSISTIYKLKEIDGDEIVIHVSSEFLGQNKMFTKTISGDYIINRITGEVLSAELKSSGFNGFSKSTSKIRIEKEK